MIVYRCDFCGEIKECVQKELDEREYDVCSECWNALEAKLRGKGRARKSRDVVLLPPPRMREREGEDRKPMPGEPPKIWGESDRPS